jgi:TolB-like protein/DNA-binding winged helix-turn-helix (wHTH) protein/Tfp pilus assembly protein PilF
MSPQAVIRFRDFELDAERYELRRAGQVQKLEKIPMELLLMLANRPGRLVSRAEIAEHLWGSGVFVDAERGINTAIAKIRRALGDDPSQPQCIQTVVGKGYRFVADVLQEPEAPSEAPVDSFSPVTYLISTNETNSRQNPDVSPRRGGARAAYVLTAGIVLLAGVIAVLKGGRLRDLVSQLLAPRISSIAVLPMANLANDSSQDYFVDGMTDQLITNLAQTTSLRVISRTSVMQFKNVKKPLPEIARMLNVDAIVEGSVMRVGRQLNIQAQLLDARRDRHLWAQTYTGSDDRALALQNEVTRDIAQHVAATLRPGAHAALRSAEAVDPRAYEDYLRGLFYLEKRRLETLKRAAELFQRVIDLSPGYAQAYVGLADTYNVMSFYGGPPPSECFPKAEVAARKALSLDPGLGEAHAALGETLFSYHWNWAGAEREFREAIRLAPEYAPAHHWYGQLLSMLRRHSEAIAEIRKAHDLDPLSLVINATVAGTLYLARDFDAAEYQANKTLELDPSYGPAHMTLAWIDISVRNGKQAVAELKKAMATSGPSASLEADLACAYAATGNIQKARSIAAELESRAKHEYVSPESLARVYVFLGENEVALDKLDQAYKMHVDTLNNIYAEPVYDRLASNLRFKALLRKMRFVK